MESWPSDKRSRAGPPPARMEPGADGFPCIVGFAPGGSSRSAPAPGLERPLGRTHSACSSLLSLEQRPLPRLRIKPKPAAAPPAVMSGLNGSRAAEPSASSAIPVGSSHGAERAASSSSSPQSQASSLPIPIRVNSRRSEEAELPSECIPRGGALHEWPKQSPSRSDQASAAIARMDGLRPSSEERDCGTLGHMQDFCESMFPLELPERSESPVGSWGAPMMTFLRCAGGPSWALQQQPLGYLIAT